MVARSVVSNNEYRYGYNTQEKVEELGEGHTTALFWEYDSRLGRRWNIDPVIRPWESSYACFSNNPNYFVDPLGLTPKHPPLIDKIKVLFGIGHFAGNKKRKNNSPFGKVIADNRVWRPNAKGDKLKTDKSPTNNVAEMKTSNIIQRYSYYQEIWSKESLTEGDISGYMNGAPIAFSTNVDSWQLKKATDNGKQDDLMYDFTKYTVKYIVAAPGAQISTHTIISVPRNDGQGTLEIRYFDKLSSAQVPLIVAQWAGGIGAAVSTEYRRVVKSYTPPKYIRSIEVTPNDNNPEAMIVGQKQTIHGRDLVNPTVIDVNLGRVYE